MARWLRRIAMLAGVVGAALELRAWRDAFLGVGEVPSGTARMVARHPGLGPGGELGWPRGVEEDDDIRWRWPRESGPRPH